MDGILKRLLTLNQSLLVLLVLCFLRFYGHQASNKALTVSRDLEVLSFLKGPEREPTWLCRSPVVQEKIDRQLQESEPGKRYLAFRNELAAFLSNTVHIGEAELASAKRGRERAYFLVNPRLASAKGNVDCAFALDEKDEAPARGDDAPNSVSTVLERGRLFALSAELTFPTQWQAPTQLKGLVPDECLPPAAPVPPTRAAPTSESVEVRGSNAAVLERIVGRAQPSSSSVPPLTLGRPQLPRVAEAPLPKTHQCRLAQVYFDTGGLHFVWLFEPPPAAQQDSWSVTTALPINGEKTSVKVPFLLSELLTVEQGWKDRLVELAKDSSRQADIKARYSGTGVDSALQQSQKIHADLVGSATLFGWNLLPDWFPVGLGAALASVLFAVFATCRSAADLSNASEIAQKIRLVDSVFFLSLSSRIGTAITWVVVPFAVLMMSLADGVTPISTIGLGLAALGLVFGGLACAKWWRLPTNTSQPPGAAPVTASAEPVDDAMAAGR